MRGRRCPAEWPHVADAVIAACTSVAKWSTIGLRERCDHDGCERMAGSLSGVEERSSQEEPCAPWAQDRS